MNGFNMELNQSSNQSVISHNIVMQETELQTLFRTITEGKDLEVNYGIVKSIIIKQLTVKAIKPVLLNILIEAFIYYIQLWPGWIRSEEYIAGRLTYNEWFLKFKHYITYKLNSILINEKETDIAQCCLKVSGMPRVVSNLIFSKEEENIIIRQKAIDNWVPLTINEFLNWPNLGVTLTLEDITLNRTNKNKSHIFLTKTNELPDIPPQEYVEFVVETSDIHEVYTYNFLKTYFEEILAILKTTGKKYEKRITEIEAILLQFLMDVDDVNLHGKTIATNATICYNIGKSKFTKCKTTDNQNAINCVEIVIPRTEITLNNLQTKIETTKKPYTFSNLNEWNEHPNRDEKLINIINQTTSIKYICQLCNENFATVENAMSHFELIHYVESPLSCLKCDSSFMVKDLASERWAHDCPDNCK